MPLTLQLVPSVCVVDQEGCARNVLSALRRGLPVCTRAPRRKGQLAIVGSGPSVLDRLDTLRSWPGEIWAINGAYRFLKSQGIVPHGFIGMDPVPGLAEYVADPDGQTTYFISSVCDPAVFDALAGQDVWLWHTKRGDLPYPEGTKTVAGGTTAMTRAPFLANLLGWRSVHLFGADSSYADGPYCYKRGTFKEDTQREPISYRVGGCVFQSELAMAKQAAQISAMYHHVFPKGFLTIESGGLVKALIEAPMRDASEFAA